MVAVSSGAAVRTHGSRSSAHPEPGSTGGSGRTEPPPRREQRPGHRPRAAHPSAQRPAGPAATRASLTPESPLSSDVAQRRETPVPLIPRPREPPGASLRRLPTRVPAPFRRGTAPRPPSRYRLSRRPPARHPFPPHSPPPAGASRGAVPVPCGGAHPGDDGSAPRGQQRQQQQQRSSAQAPHAAGPRPPALPAGAARWSRPGAAPAVIKLGAAVPRRESPPRPGSAAGRRAHPSAGPGRGGGAPAVGWGQPGARRRGAPPGVPRDIPGGISQWVLGGRPAVTEGYPREHPTTSREHRVAAREHPRGRPARCREHHTAGPKGPCSRWETVLQVRVHPKASGSPKWLVPAWRSPHSNARVLSAFAPAGSVAPQFPTDQLWKKKWEEWGWGPSALLPAQAPAQ